MTRDWVEAHRERVDKLRMFFSPQLWTERGATLLAGLIGAAVILLLGRLAAKIAADMVRRVLDRSHTEPTLVRFLSSLVYALILAFVIIAALERVGVNTTSFAAVVAAAGLAIGFALQGSLSNFAAGVMIILLGHFRAGDLIEAAGQKGRVVDVQIFSTVLIDESGVKVIVPNGAITSGTIRVHREANAAAQTPAPPQARAG
ncbi:MAG TPA: mechanosensitive ion channel domain-containing protein [Myxococcales bacterium]|nr:mechanosensitive ion channel domain-containing protein [Myxococcales bacterium]